jgi:hypothetical protein
MKITLAGDFKTHHNNNERFASKTQSNFARTVKDYNYNYSWYPVF